MDQRTVPAADYHAGIKRDTGDTSMNQISRRTFIELAGASMLCGCGGSTGSTGSGSSSVLVFSDVHFNPLYDLSLLTSLDAADPSQWKSIYEGSRATALPAYGADSNYRLFKLALASIQQNLAGCQLVVFSGDLLGHNIGGLYTQNGGSANQASINSFINKTTVFVTQQIRTYLGSVPVVFAVGNCDSYTGYGPDSGYLSSTVDSFYSQLLNGIADRQQFTSTFLAGGYYSVDVFEKQLKLISLNTIMCSGLIMQDYSIQVAKQFAWLDAQLAAAKRLNQKAWIVMHVPPGIYMGGTNDNTGQLAGVSMMWYEEYQNSFLEILAKYPGQISFLLAGHTHMDEYRILSPEHVVEVTPGISPVFGNDPAFKLFTIDTTTFTAADYQAIKYSLATAPLDFAKNYTFTSAYSLPSCANVSLKTLFPQLTKSSALQALFRSAYFSGSASQSLITNLNWPAYWSCVGNVTELAFIKSVTGYS
jgi:hypothetical protein